MTFKDADKIYKDWKEYMEINDKLLKIFSFIPESFLPYPIKTLEEAINIVAKSYFDEGDIKTSNIIKNSIGFLVPYKNDEKALEDILENYSLKNSKIRKIKLTNLKKAQDSWLKINSIAPRCYACGHKANIIKEDSN